MAGKVEQPGKDQKMEAEEADNFLGRCVLCSYSIMDIVVVPNDDSSMG